MVRYTWVYGFPSYLFFILFLGACDVDCLKCLSEKTIDIYWSKTVPKRQAFSICKVLLLKGFGHALLMLGCGSHVCIFKKIKTEPKGCPAMHTHTVNIYIEYAFEHFRCYQMILFKPLQRWILPMVNNTLWYTNITMENHHFLWVNQLFLWPFSIANVCLPEGNWFPHVSPSQEKPILYQNLSPILMAWSNHLLLGSDIPNKLDVKYPPASDHRCGHFTVERCPRSCWGGCPYRRFRLPSGNQTWQWKIT